MRSPWPDVRPGSQSFRKLATIGDERHRELRVKAGESALEA